MFEMLAQPEETTGAQEQGEYFYIPEENCFYHSAVHSIPPTAVPVDEATYAALQEGMGKGLRLIGPDATHTAPWLAEALPPSLEQTNTKKYTEIISGANDMDTAIKARYSTLEVASFEQQRQGAEAIIADENIQGSHGSPVALVRGLAAVEGVSALDFAKRILFNVAQASAAMEAILLQQRGYEAALKKAATVEEVESITVVYTLG